MALVKRIWFTMADGRRRVTSAKDDAELEIALRTMEELGETVDLVEEVDLTPRELLNDLYLFVHTDPVVREEIAAKHIELEHAGTPEKFDEWLGTLIGTMYADVMNVNKWQL